ncbi:hypothetical protein BML2526_05730 [Providencia rettgeri]|uniref:hypothetical protein n=1 Tax=Providencia rettgeri TaxID=587 RepID=UPI001373EF46|nr:hypothetical protein [Providencia rettgeri]BBU98920.1 hypothetical protein BML2526_05730 [Providencia rettgeri]BBV13890.1 hypothetical protein BML2576_33490 [Providencia rettgeri]BDH19994.1 hypothetical protein PrNR1418_32850 [Providencia rettgeri]
MTSPRLVQHLSHPLPLNALAAQVNQANQGKLQGILVSLANAPGVIGPLALMY